MALPPKWYQFLVCVFASLGSVLYGYDLGVIAEALTSPSLINAFNADATKRGAVTSVFTGGAFFGAYFAGPLGDYAGRKWTIFVGALIFLLGGYAIFEQRWTIARRLTETEACRQVRRA